jgi:SnoaL-like protein
MNIEQKLQQLEDRIAIRELIDQYAYCADTRDAQGQMSLFTADTNFEVYMDSKSSTPTQVINNRQGLFPVFDNLNTYLATMHFNGQSTLKLDGDRASGVTYCRAYHLNVQDGVQKLMIAGIRYFDIMVKQEGKWVFAERKLKVCWVENR